MILKALHSWSNNNKLQWHKVPLAHMFPFFYHVLLLCDVLSGIVEDYLQVGPLSSHIVHVCKFFEFLWFKYMR